MLIDCEIISKRIIEGLKKELDNTGRTKYVVGLSGGIDSSLSASFAVEAVGADNVIGVSMPYKTSNQLCTGDAQKLAQQLKMKFFVTEISNIVDAYSQLEHVFGDDTEVKDRDSARVRLGNIAARTRMSIIYDLSSRFNGLVLGTGNKSEWLLGYTTLWGDMCCDINPLGALYKLHVKQLAKHRKLPESILNRAPSADLWQGQTDEDEMQVAYAQCDRILEFGYDYWVPSNTIREMGFKQEWIDRIVGRVEGSEHKRRMPIVIDPFEDRDHDEKCDGIIIANLVTSCH